MTNPVLPLNNDLVSLMNGISTFVGYLMLYLSVQKNTCGTILSIAGVVLKEFYSFPEGFSPKVNVIAWQEFELAYYNVAVQNFSLDTHFRKEIS